MNFETPQIKFPLHGSSPPAAADTDICHWHSDPHLLSLFLFSSRRSKIFHLQRAVCFSNGTAGFPVSCSILPHPYMGPFMERDSPLHSLLWRPWYQAQRTVFYPPLLLLYAKDAAGVAVALQGDLAVCLALCMVPHTNYHCSVVSGGNRVSAWAAQNIGSFCCLCKGRRSRKLPVFT